MDVLHRDKCQMMAASRVSDDGSKSGVVVGKYARAFVGMMAKVVCRYSLALTSRLEEEGP